MQVSHPTKMVTLECTLLTIEKSPLFFITVLGP